MNAVLLVSIIIDKNPSYWLLSIMSDNFEECGPPSSKFFSNNLVQNINFFYFTIFSKKKCNLRKYTQKTDARPRKKSIFLEQISNFGTYSVPFRASTKDEFQQNL